jgi:hypothetical protein
MRGRPIVPLAPATKIMTNPSFEMRRAPGGIICVPYCMELMLNDFGKHTI